MPRKFAYKTIILSLLFSFLFSAILPESMGLENMSLSPYSIFELVAQEQEKELKKLTKSKTPACQGTSTGRVAEFGRAWVSKCAKKLADKMVHRVDELRGKVTLEEAETELLRVIKRWAGENDVPRYRRDKLVDAIYEEFGKLSPDLKEKRKVQKSKFRTRLAELKKNIGGEWEDKVIYFDFNGKKVQMEISFFKRSGISFFYDAGCFFVDETGKEREIGSIRFHVTYDGVIRFPLCSIEIKKSLCSHGFDLEMALRAIMDAKLESTKQGFRPSWVLARYTTGSFYSLGETGKRLIEFVKKLGFERATYSTGGYSSGLHSVVSKYSLTSVMYYAPLGHIQKELERRTSNAAPEKVIGEVTHSTREMATHRLLNIKGDGSIDLSKTVVVMKRNLTKGFTKEGMSVTPFLEMEYKKMKQELRKLFNSEKNIIEVNSKRGLITKINELMKDPSIKVIVLGDDAITEEIEQKDIKGKAGKDYCVITAKNAGNSNERLVQFVNLNAMAFMGVGILNSDSMLFESAYRTFTGDTPTTEMCDKVKQGVLWIIKVFPRMIRLTDTIQDREIFRRLFAAAA